VAWSIAKLAFTALNQAFGEIDGFSFRALSDGPKLARDLYIQLDVAKIVVVKGTLQRRALLK
jgi:hypothetical protein